MKTRSLSIGALAGILAATSVFAATPTINITRQSGYYSGSGGEFTIRANQNIFYTPYSATVPVTIAGSSFQTFALETGAAAVAASSTTISIIVGTNLTYGGGAGTSFVLLNSANAADPLDSWERLATNSATPGSFTIPAVGTGTSVFYRIESEGQQGDYVTLGNNYTAYVDSAIHGGNGTKTLSVGAAYLYAQFIAGTLSGYNYTAGSGRSASAGLLQQTIWWTMGLASNPGGAFVADLAAAGIATPTAAISGAYYETTIGQTIWDVAILNLGIDGDSSATDLLISWNRAVPQATGVADGGRR